MIKILLFLFVTLNVYAFELPYVRVSIDKKEYSSLEKSVLVAEINSSPANSEYEFTLETALNGIKTGPLAKTDFIWSIVSAPLMPGTNLWSVKLYFTKKTFSVPIKVGIERKKAMLQTEMDQDNRNSILEDIKNLELKLQGLRRFVDDYTIEFNVINRAPVAEMTAPDSTRVAKDVVIDGKSSVDSDGSIVRYDWKLGDGNIVNDGGPSIIHSYDNEGEYEIVLFVTDNLGGQSTFTKVIQVQPFSCVFKDDYTQRDCEGTFIASKMEDLFSYSNGYGLENNKYKHLKLAFPLDPLSSIEIHSPCKVSVAQNLVLKAFNLCLDAAEGISQTDVFSIDASKDIFIFSDQKDLNFPGGMSIHGRDLRLESGGSTTLGENIKFSLTNLFLKSTDVSRVKAGAEIQILDEVHIEGSGCEISPDAQISAPVSSGNCL